MAKEKARWSPTKAAVVTFLLTLLVVAVVGIAVTMATLPSGDSHYEAGEALGRPAAIASILAAAIAYFIQKRRIDPK